MSKIARYAGNLRAFGSNAQGLERTLFGETTQADDLTSQVTASFLRGWGVVGPSENPSLEDFNAAMYTMSQFIAYQHQMGVPEWDSRQEYYVGSICVHDGDSYISLADGNTNSKPPSAKWTTVLTAKNALANITGFLNAKNNLSEIKDAGQEAVAETLANLGLDDVIRKSDTNVQLPGKLTTKGDIKATEGDLYSGDARLEHDGNIFADVWGDSLFAYINRMRNTASLGESGWHRDAATGTIRQWGRTPAFGAGAGFLINFPIPFPTKIVSVNGILIRPGNTSTGSAETLYIGEPSSLTSVRMYHGGSETYPALWEVEGY
ncbi:hypothetical protein ACMU9U_004062 [Yersinia enterocolitica]